jgi:hypothetical protein
VPDLAPSCPVRVFAPPQPSPFWGGSPVRILFAVETPAFRIVPAGLLPHLWGRVGGGRARPCAIVPGPRLRPTPGPRRIAACAGGGVAATIPPSVISFRPGAAFSQHVRTGSRHHPGRSGGPPCGSAPPCRKNTRRKARGNARPQRPRAIRTPRGPAGRTPRRQQTSLAVRAKV